jgi:transposase
MKQKESWKITDEFWKEIQHLIPTRQRCDKKEYKRKPGGGRKPIEPRKALEAIFYVLRTGTQWKALPKEFGASSAIHRYFIFWCEQGFFQAIWLAGLERYDEIKGIDWTWLSGDGCTTKAPLAQESVGKNPTDRGKNGEQASPPCRRQGRTSGNRRDGG